MLERDDRVGKIYMSTRGIKEEERERGSSLQYFQHDSFDGTKDTRLGKLGGKLLIRGEIGTF